MVRLMGGVQAASENLGLKQTLFRELAKACRPDAILATNTSSIRSVALRPR